MAKFNFNLRNANSDKPTPVYLVVRWENQRLVVSTEETINPMFWNHTKQRATETKKFPEFPEFNTRLNQLLTDISNLHRVFVNDNKRQPTKTELKDKIEEYKTGLDNSIKDNSTVLEYINKYILEAKLRHNKKGNPLSKSTILSINQLRKLIEEFSKYKKRKYLFDDITLDFYYDFMKFMKEQKLYATNTIGKRIKGLKTIIRDATERGVNKKLDFMSERFCTIQEETESVYLNEEELNLINDLDLSNFKRLENVRDLFLIGCWTGLRFSDFSRLTEENIKKGFIEIITQKTQREVVIPIHPIVKNILLKYEGRLPRSLSNQKMNVYIKEVCSMIPELSEKISKSMSKGGLKVSQKVNKYELITTHTARRSFASNMYLDNMPSKTIMEITGHKTEKQLLEYIKLTPKEHANKLQLHWDKKYKLNG